MENKYKWLNEASLHFLSQKGGYLLEGEEPEDRFNLIATTLENELGIEGYKEEFLYFLQNKFYALSTPFIANVGRDNAMPFSCSNQHIGDSLGEIMFAKAETGMMSKMGMGCSGYMSLRGKGSPITNSTVPSPGSLYFAGGFQDTIKEVNQGVRRGYMALYWDIEHEDIEEVLNIGRDGHPLQDINYGVCISDDFMIKAKNGDVKCRKILAKVHESRFMTGLPYIFFKDNVNKSKPDVYKDHNLEIKSSNLCTEILEVSNEEYSFVCDIAAMNAEMYEHPEFPKAVKILVYALDALHSIFQRKLEKWRDSDDIELKLRYEFLRKAYKSSCDFRDIGVGMTGYHSLLQSKMIPFESFEAKLINSKLFSTLQKYTLEASRELAELFGEPKMLRGYGRRNCLLNAIAPNTSSAFILGQISQGIEPYSSNYYVKDLAKSKHVIKNKYLEELLEKLGKNTSDIWHSISLHDGSVQHLDFLTEDEKKVFRTWQEISPMEIVVQAAQRQKFIDQSQSLNLMINQNVNLRDLNQLVYKAWELGVKTLYYQHSTNAAQQLRKDILTCESCAG